MVGGEAAETDGILVIDKEVGPTSHDVVAGVRRVLGQRRVGHCGTLDPLATGVLVVCLGRYTRLSQWLGDEDKEYLTTLVLGANSDTGDAQGRLEPGPGGPLPSVDELVAALHRLEGTRDQVPPAYSAVKVNGVPSYRLARRDAAVPLAPRTVRVGPIQLLAYEPPRVTLRVDCGKGTYIRSLATELGLDLECGAYVEALRRLRAGALGEERAVTLDRLVGAADAGVWADLLVPVEQALAGLPRVALDSAGSRSFRHGNPVTMPAQVESGAVVAVFDQSRAFCGIGAWDPSGRALAPRAVLGGTELSAEAAVHG